MMETAKRTASLFLFIAIVLISGAQAQDYIYDTGAPTYGIKIPIDHGFIDVSNGNFHLDFSLSRLPQRGKLQLNERLEYDSRIWKIVEGSGYSWQPTNVPNSMGGWRFVSGMESGSVTYQTLISSTSCVDGFGHYYEHTYTNFRWKDPQGTSHLFYGESDQYDHPIDCNGNPTPDSPDFNSTASDGSGYVLSVTNYTNATVYDSAGNQVYPTRMDTNGNYFSQDSNGNLIDTLGRTPVITTVSGNNIYYDVLTIGDARARYTVTTTPISVNTSFGQSAVGEFSGSFTVIQKITLPDGTSYSFGYDTGTTSGHYGEMTSMTLPTGATVYFSYINWQDSFQNKNEWLQQYFGATTINFTPTVLTQCSSGETGCQEQITVSGVSDSVYTLKLDNGAWNTQTDVYEGPSTGSNPDKLVSIATTYNYSGSVITASEQTTTLPDTGQVAKTDYSYNFQGQPTAVKEWDYYTGAPSTNPTRETDYEYGYGVNGAALLTKTTIRDSSGTPVTQTVINYDEPSGLTTTTTGLPGHEAVTGNRGNVTSVVTGLSSSGETLTTRYTYDDAGSVLSSQDPLLHTTSYGYDSTDAYVTQITRPVTSNGVPHITGAAYDFSTGLVTGSTDENHNTTSYSYDPNTLRPLNISYPGGGSITYSYPSPIQTVQTVAQTSASSTITTTTLDEYGRYSSASVADSLGDTTTTTTYQDDDTLICVTAPQRSTASSTDGTTCDAYDGLGRLRYQTQPDSHTITYSYVGNTVTVTDENGNSKKYQYDAFRNLTAVWEPDSVGALNWETDYQYNTLGQLTRIDQKGGSTESGQWRTRLFSYNSLGQLQQETVPEVGTIGTGPTPMVFTYDGGGNLKTVQNGNGTTTYAYDELNRVIQKSYSDNSTPTTYAYDVSTWGATNPVGRLVGSSRGNGAAAFYSYDALGRVVSESNPRTSNTTVNAYTVAAGYDLAGNLTSLTYPDGRVIAQGFDNVNRLNSVTYSQWGTQPVGTPYFSAATYAPTGALTGGTFGNGIQLSATYNNRQSIASLQYTQNNTTLWSRLYTWAANASNLVAMDDLVNSANNRSFTYDANNRLLSVNYAAASSGTATITISGADQDDTINTCPDAWPKICMRAVVNSGQVTVVIAGELYSVSYGTGDSAATLASAMATAMNNGTLVNATPSGGQVFVTARATGLNSNYSVSTSCSYSPYYEACAWSATAPSTLAGGHDGSGSGSSEETYSYDPWGNLNQAGIWSFDSNIGSNNQIIAATYDAAGNLTNDGVGNAYSYTIDGMLSSSNGESYQYDGESRRVRKDGPNGTVEYIYFGGQLIAERNVATGAWTDFVYGPAGAIAEAAGSQSAAPVYRIADYLGSVSQTKDASGNPLDGISFLPYGQVESGSTTDPIRFTGLEVDSENGSYHAWYRQLSPAQGRWLSPDPYDGSYDLGDPQSLNRYAYVRGMPMNATDPSGLFAPAYMPPEAAAACPWCAPVVIGADIVGGLLDIFHFGRPHFHGSLKPRPSIGGNFPDGETLGIPTGMSLPSPTLAGFLFTSHPGWVIENWHTDSQGYAVGDFAGELLCNNVGCQVWNPLIQLWDLANSGGMITAAPSQPWYQNPCVTGALAKGAVTAGIDAIGLLPEGGAVAETFSLFHGAAGVSNGVKIVQRVKAGAAILSTTSALNDGSALSTALGVAGFIPGLGQLAAGASIVLDIAKTGMAVAQCY